MKPHTLTIKGLLAFPEAVTINFDAMPVGVYAVWGRNGAGKTTLIESLAAPIYREFPSRKKGLPDYATRRDALLELDFDMGDERLLAHVDVDHHDRTTAALLESIHDGVKTKLNDGKVKTYDHAMLARVPPLSQLLASAFGIQSRKGSFIQIDQVARKELFQRLIGGERYTKLAAAAKTKRDAAQAALQTADAVAAALMETGNNDALARAHATLQELTERSGLLAGAVTRAQEAHAAAQVTLDLSAKDLREAEDLAATIADDRTKHVAATLELDLATTALRRAAIVRERVPPPEVRGDVLSAKVAALSQQGTRTEADLQQKIDQIDLDLKAEPAVLAAAERLVALTDEMARADDRINRARARWTDASERATVAEFALRDQRELETRLQNLDRAIETGATVPCHGEGVFASCRFLTDLQVARRERSAAGVPEVAAASAALDVARREVDQCWEETIAAEKARGELDRSSSADRALVSTRASFDVSRARRVDLVAAMTANAAATSEAIAAAVKQNESYLAADAVIIAEHDRLVAEEAARRREKAALEVHQAEWDSIDERVAKARRIHEIHKMTVTQRGDDATRCAAEASSAETSRKHAAAALETTIAAHAKYAQARAETELQSRDVADWNQFLRVFGRDGLPMIEIDQAGPAVTAHANMLLGPLFGGRFTMQLVTQVPTSDGKAMKDVFDIEVFDGQFGGAKRSISDLSGGQAVVLDEVVKSAISLFMNQQNVQPVLTCIRDETTGALDSEVIHDYVALLRKVREIGGFHHLFFVSHNIDAVSSADGILWVHDGQVDVCFPPFDTGALESHTFTSHGA